jgi:hypothetical protein
VLLWPEEFFPTMSNPVSVPAAASQPNQQFYGGAALNLFQTYDRASYFQAFGVQPPTYDSSRPSKAWFDSTQDANDHTTLVTYGYWESQTGPSLPTRASETMTAAEAASVNIPGVRTFPQYVISPSQVTQAGSGIDPTNLSLFADAVSLAAELGLPASAVADGSFTGPFPTVYPAGEQRRLWVLMFKGVANYAGALLAQQYAHGVGAPGSWDVSGPSPVWRSAQPVTEPLLNPTLRPVPQRPLLPNEMLSVTLMGWSVERTDLGTPQPTGGGLDDAQAQQLARVDTNLGALLDFFRIPRAQ